MTVPVVLAVAAAVCAVSLCLTGCLLMLIAASKPKVRAVGWPQPPPPPAKPLTSEDYTRLVEAEEEKQKAAAEAYANHLRHDNRRM